MPQHSPIDQRVTRSRRRRSRTVSDKAVRHTVHVPTPHGGRRTIQSTRTKPNIFERAGFSSLGNFFGSGIVGELGLGYSSRTQSAGFFSELFQLGQRVR
jgi:hypothetical protein